MNSNCTYSAQGRYACKSSEGFNDVMKTPVKIVSNSSSSKNTMPSMSSSISYGTKSTPTNVSSPVTLKKNGLYIANLHCVDTMTMASYQGTFPIMGSRYKDTEMQYREEINYGETLKCRNQGFTEFASIDDMTKQERSTMFV